MHYSGYSVSYVDDGVSLDVVHVWVTETQFFSISLCGADNSCRHCVLQGKRAADSNHKLTRAQVCRVTQQ